MPSQGIGSYGNSGRIPTRRKLIDEKVAFQTSYVYIKRPTSPMPKARLQYFLVEAGIFHERKRASSYDDLNEIFF